MSGAFDDVMIEWRGIEYKIPARNMMGAIARIEDHITLPELQRYSERGTAPLSRLAASFASVLRFAGASTVKDEDVYAAMFEGQGEQQSVASALRVLLSMMVPKNARSKVTATTAVGEPTPGNSQPAVTSSSKKPSRSRSVPLGSHRRNSGRSRSKNSTG